MSEHKSKPLQVATQTIYPGESISLALSLPEIFSCSPLHMPIKIIHGKTEGPCMLIMAALHGDELNGTEIINQLLEDLSSKKIAGTLIAIPVFNVYGFINRSRTLPGGVNIDRHFPGAEHGSLAERMTNLFIKEIFHHADICIDLQTGMLNHTNLPQIYADFHDAASKELAAHFHAPVVSTKEPEEGSLHSFASQQKKPYLLYKAGQAMHFDTQAIRVGVAGLKNLMKKLNMLKQKEVDTKKEKKPSCLFSEENIFIRAAKSGISHTQYEIGDIVKKNQAIAIIKDPFAVSEDVVIKSPEDGIIVGKNNLPLTYEGSTIFQLAMFDKMNAAADQIEQWTKSQAEQTESTHD